MHASIYHPFINVFTCSLIYQFIHNLICSCINLPVHSSTHSFIIHSFTPPFIQEFIHSSILISSKGTFMSVPCVRTKLATGIIVNLTRHYNSIIIIIIWRIFRCVSLRFSTAIVFLSFLC